MGEEDGYKGGCNHPDDDNFFLFSFHLVPSEGGGLSIFIFLFSSLVDLVFSPRSFLFSLCFLDLRSFFAGPVCAKIVCTSSMGASSLFSYSLWIS